ncbi:MAG: hypothetical protein AAF628_10845 [Planctomycetota bacterium]
MRGLFCWNADSISLGWNGLPYGAGGGFVWGEGMIELEALGRMWTPGNDITVCFDLSSMPDTVGGETVYRNLLDELADGELEMYVQDDTAIDSITLTIVRQK